MSAQPPKPSRPLAVDLGRKVVIDLISTGETERLELDLVEDQFADFRLGFLGMSTPLAKALAGKYPGQTVPYKAGGATAVRIISVSPSERASPNEIAERRQETYRKAVDDADRTNAMIFASSFTGKWGDYDPTGFTENTDDEEPEEPEG